MATLLQVAAGQGNHIAPTRGPLAHRAPLVPMGAILVQTTYKKPQAHRLARLHRHLWAETPQKIGFAQILPWSKNATTKENSTNDSMSARPKIIGV